MVAVLTHASSGQDRLMLFIIKLPYDYGQIVSMGPKQNPGLTALYNAASPLQLSPDTLAWALNTCASGVLSSGTLIDL